MNAPPHLDPHYGSQKEVPYMNAAPFTDAVNFHQGNGKSAAPNATHSNAGFANAANMNAAQFHPAHPQNAAPQSVAAPSTMAAQGNPNYPANGYRNAVMQAPKPQQQVQYQQHQQNAPKPQRKRRRNRNWQQPNSYYPNNGQPGQPNQNKNANVQCRRCLKLGHTLAQCYLTKGVCFGCQGSGHLVAQCPNGGNVCSVCSQQGHWGRNCPNRPVRNVMGRPPCGNCGEVGHFSRGCPNPINQCATCGMRGHRTITCRLNRQQAAAARPSTPAVAVDRTPPQANGTQQAGN